MNIRNYQSIEKDLKNFTARNFEKPADCKNLDQIRYYVRELSVKIEELRKKFNYVPDWAYILLAQYNAKQNSLIGIEFKKVYC